MPSKSNELTSETLLRLAAFMAQGIVMRNGTNTNEAIVARDAVRYAKALWVEVQKESKRDIPILQPLRTALREFSEETKKEFGLEAKP